METNTKENIQKEENIQRRKSGTKIKKKKFKKKN